MGRAIMIYQLNYVSFLITETKLNQELNMHQERRAHARARAQNLALGFVNGLQNQVQANNVGLDQIAARNLKFKVPFIIGIRPFTREPCYICGTNASEARYCPTGSLGNRNGPDCERAICSYHWAKSTCEEHNVQRGQPHDPDNCGMILFLYLNNLLIIFRSFLSSKIKQQTLPQL